MQIPQGARQKDPGAGVDSEGLTTQAAQRRQMLADIGKGAEPGVQPHHSATSLSPWPQSPHQQMGWMEASPRCLLMYILGSPHLQIVGVLTELCAWAKCSRVTQRANQRVCW